MKFGDAWRLSRIPYREVVYKSIAEERGRMWWGAFGRRHLDKDAKNETELTKIALRVAKFDKIIVAVFAVIAAGRTLAPMTNNLINGVGEDVEIKFNALIPDSGSHIMFDRYRKPVPYTAVENLYHELAHAMHKMTGRWEYFNSERAAIREENEFRRDEALLRGGSVTERIYVTGAPVCSGANPAQSAPWGQDILCSIQ